MNKNFLFLTRLGIDTHQEPVVYMREDCHICRSEGFNAQGRVEIRCGERNIIASLNIVKGELLSHEKAGLSEAAWRLLEAQEGEKAQFRHAPPVGSMSHVRGKLYGKPFTLDGARHIINDINHGRYSDIQLSSYVTACAADKLSIEETVYITRAMVETGRQYNWGKDRIVVDKHCVGGLPGNRTTPIIVAIVAANGLLMPKTSSRAITSPAGTADTMETLTTVALDFETMRRVVESEGQLVASVISKKVAAGSSQVLIDIPVGPTAKVRSLEMAEHLTVVLQAICAAQGGLKSPPTAEFTRDICAEHSGILAMYNNRVLSRLATLAGAPNAPAAGLQLHARLGEVVEAGQPLMTLHAEAAGELEYAMDFYQSHPDALHIEEEVI